MTKTIAYQKYFNELLNSFPKRSQDIIKMRYGIGFEKAYTLEHIGSKYGITRERVRQIVKSVTAKVRKELEQENAVDNQVIRDMMFVIKDNSGIIEENVALKKLAKLDKTSQNVLVFFSYCTDKMKIIEKESQFEKCWVFDLFDLKRVKKFNALAKEILARDKKVLTDDQIVDKIKKETGEFSDKEILDFLGVSSEIKKNIFGKWGLKEWSDINPRGMREKAYLVLKEEEKPLHFRIIADLIDKYELAKRKAHPQTVHNELIKDERFVLIGRGIYALAQWGYRPGTVKDVIQEIIQKSDKPLSREDIIERVLKTRKVRKTTILVNLNNSRVFQRVNSGYVLKVK